MGLKAHRCPWVVLSKAWSFQEVQAQDLGSGLVPDLDLGLDLGQDLALGQGLVWECGQVEVEAMDQEWEEQWRLGEHARALV